MNQNSDKSHYRSWLQISVCCILFCCFCQTKIVHALDRKKHVTPIMFIGGFGLQFESALVGTSAQNNYDQYLNTVGSKIASHREKYKRHHNLSLIIKRTGIGIIGLTTLISILDQAEIISNSNPKKINTIRILPLHDPNQHKLAFILQKSF